MQLVGAPSDVSSDADVGCGQHGSVSDERQVALRRNRHQSRIVAEVLQR